MSFPCKKSEELISPSRTDFMLGLWDCQWNYKIPFEDTELH